VREAAQELLERLQAADIRTKLDTSDKSFGWKAAEYEMKGVPLRVEIGPRDLAAGQCCITRRDNGEKYTVALEDLEKECVRLMDELHKAIYEKALANREAHTKICQNIEEVKNFMQEEKGFAKTMWCGDEACEIRMKEEAGVTSRCMPFAQEQVSETCVCCGKPAKKMIYWGIAY
jgi:prolyl-tRNA synthetase